MKPGFRISFMKRFLFIPLMVLMSFMKPDKKALRYIALGDSYTICTGTTSTAEQWPNILADHLTKAGIPVEAVSNPSRNGFSTQNLIDHELPLLKTGNYDFATLLIGVNDWVRAVDAKTYHKNLIYIIDEVQKALPDKSKLILITIPDFGVTPQGALYGGGRDISKGIAEFNDIMKAEAKKRGLTCVDIFRLSKGMFNHKELVAADELHPSAKEYALWEALIFPEVKKLVSGK
jgi:lysophospholipase L1-like esterase